MRTRVLVVGATLLLVSTITAAVPAAAAAPDRRLPPSTKAELTRIFDPKVRDLGFRTTRALLQNLDTYAEDPNGRHLAIYLEPIADDFTDGEFVDSFTDVAKVFLPLVFDRWKGLTSFDVCLEPLPSEDSSVPPEPMTQVLVTRRGLRFLDWHDATLVDVLVTAKEHEATDSADVDFYVFFRDRLEDQPPLVEAREAAAQR